MMIAEKMLLFPYLIVNTVTDIKFRKIYWPLSAAVLTAGFLLHLFAKGKSPLESILGLIPGLLLFCICAINGNAIGSGDCLTICAIGSVLGASYTSVLSLFSMIMAAIWGVMLLVSKRGTRKTAFAFMPFVLFAHAVLSITWFFL